MGLNDSFYPQILGTTNFPLLQPKCFYIEFENDLVKTEGLGVPEVHYYHIKM